MSQDAVVIGGGFYGAAIAIYLARQRGLNTVLVEQEASLLTRASYNNQARVHNGYHYPRSFTTAYRSRVNMPRFVRDWPDAVKQNFTKLYAIARSNSKVNSNQFERFCRQIGSSLQKAGPDLRKLFQPRLIEEVYRVEEYAFDATKLTAWAERELEEAGVQVRYGTRATSIYRRAGGMSTIVTATWDRLQEAISSRYVINCTYSGINQLTGDYPGTRMGLKQEITEMALVKVPSALEGLGITVMDGPFFSLMPFPPRALHTLSHVRYTPHLHWVDEQGKNPYKKLKDHHLLSRVDRMIRDVGRYLPAALEMQYEESLFEVKTVLIKNEGDDGRPILFEKHAELPGCYSVLGGKIDNIYDVLEQLDREIFNGMVEREHISRRGLNG